jgi:hypothetical protein
MPPGTTGAGTFASRSLRSVPRNRFSAGSVGFRPDPGRDPPRGMFLPFEIDRVKI